MSEGGTSTTAPTVVSDDVTKAFKLYNRPSGRLLEWMTLNRVRRHEPYHVLKGVSLEAAPGECVGIIGRNGCGKSTLLRILSGSLSQTSGRVSVRGRVFALIELSTGFNRTLSGAQNIEFAAQMLGIDREYVRARRDEIIEFADLGRYIDRPLHEYSSGMRSRLSFSLFAFLEPDVLMIDEAFSVGDEAFQKKSYALLERMITDEDRTVLIVSHAMHVIQRLCQRVAWLDEGVVRMVGEPDKVCDAYTRFMGQATSKAARRPGFDPSGMGPSGVPLAPRAFRAQPLTIGGGGGDAGSGDPALLALWVLDDKSKPAATAAARGPFRLCAAIRFEKPAPTCAFVLRIFTDDGWLVAHSDSESQGSATPTPAGASVITCSWRLKPLGLAPGAYRVEVEVRPIDGGAPLLRVERAGVLEIEGSSVVDSVYDALLPPGFVEHLDDQ